MSKKKHIMSLRLSDKHHKYLIQKAENTGQSINSIISGLIEDKMERFSHLNDLVRDILSERIEYVLKNSGI